MDELCTLLQICATHSSDIVTLWERLKWNLQLMELEGLQGQEEKEAVELLMAENSSCSEKRRLTTENWAAIKSQSLSMVHSFISFKKSLKKVIEDMKEELIRVSGMLLMHQVMV